MHLWTTIRFWLRARFRRAAVQREIDEEIGYHVDQCVEELRAQGLSAREARRVALERFGDVTHVRRRLREEYLVDGERGGEMMWETFGDLRYALRSVVRQPGFAASVILTLAVGIGANSAIFTVLHGVLLDPLPYEEPSELVRLWQADRVNGTRFENFSAPDFFDVAERNTVFVSQATVEFRSLTLTDTEGEAARVSAVATSHEYLDVLGVPLAMGRWFSADEVLEGGASVAVLGHGLWTTRYGANPSIIGRSVLLEGVSFEIVGVASPIVDFPGSDVSLWVPLHIGPETYSRGQHGLPVLARMAEGVTVEQANANLASIASALEIEQPEDNEGRGMWAQPLHESVVGEISAALYLLSGAVGLVLLIACVNVANLLLARANSRSREVAIRLAMGVGRPRLMRQLLTEYVVLGGLGGAVGLAFAFAGVRLLRGLELVSLPRVDNVAIDGTVLSFTLAVALGTGLLCGLVPALQATRADVTRFLTDGGRGSGPGVRGRRLRNGLVVAEIAMTVVVASSAGLLIESLSRINRTDPGFDPTGVITAEVQLPTSRYEQSRPDWPNYPEVLAFQRALSERITALPNVSHVGMALVLPTSAGWTTRFAIGGVPTAEIDPTAEVHIRVMTSSYPETIGMELVRGRLPDERDDLFESPPVALINEAMVERYFGDSDPIGATIDNWGTAREIIGVVRDVRFMGPTQPAEPAAYPLFAQMPFGGFSIVARTNGDPGVLAASLRAAVADVDPALAIGPIAGMEDLLAARTGPARFNGLLLGIFAAVSLLLAAVGIYGVVSYGVAQRSHEIGVRMSLGAGRTAVTGEVVGGVLRLALLGVAVGLAGILAIGPLVSGLLYGVRPFDLGNVAAVTGLCIAVALAAAYLPARRASRVNPVSALRQSTTSS